MNSDTPIDREAMLNRLQDDQAIMLLAHEIARQNAPSSVLRTIPFDPWALARAMFLLGWQPPHEGSNDEQ